MTPEEKKLRDYAYKKNHFHRIGLDIPIEDKDAYKAAAALEGLPLNTWIRGLMVERAGELGIIPPSLAADRK